MKKPSIRVMSEAEKKINENLKRVVQETENTVNPQSPDYYDECLRIADYLQYMFNMVYRNLSHATLRKHLRNLFDFMFYAYTREEESPVAAFNAATVSRYLGDWYITHCAYSTVNSSKATAAGIKKMAAVLFLYDMISETQYSDLLETIRENLPVWIQRMDNFNNGIDDLDDAYGTDEENERSLEMIFEILDYI